MVERLSRGAVHKAFRETSFDQLTPVSEVSSDQFNILYRGSQALGGSLVLFDGHIFGDELRHPRYNPPPYDTARALMGDPMRTSGVYALGLVDTHASSLILHTDALGQYNLFYLQDGRDFIVSNNPFIIERLAIPSECRNVESVAIQLLYLSAFPPQSVFNDIHVLPARHELSFSPAEGMKISEVIPRKQLYLPEMDYDAALARAVESVRDNCAMIADFTARFGVHTVVDLSGGIDTRMVAAGFIGAGRHRDVYFSCINNSRTGMSEDRVAAEAICSTFDLASAPIVADSPFSTTTHNSRKGFSSGGARSYGATNYFGLASAAFADYGEVRLDRFARVGGYCGEHARAPGPNLRLEVGSRGNAEDFAAKYLYHAVRPKATTARKFVKAEAHDIFIRSFSSYFSEILEELPPKLVNTVTYVENRSRCHFGTRSQSANRSGASFSPLATPNVLALHQHLSYSEIFNKKIAHDLIYELAGPRLAYLPFANDFWRPNVLPNQHKDYSTSYEIAKASPAGSRPQVNCDPVQLRDQDSAQVASTYDEWRGHRKLADDYRSLALYVMDLAGPNSELWRMVNKDTVVQEAEKGRLSENEHRNFLSFFAASIFYLGVTDIMKICDKEDIPAWMTNGYKTES